MVDEAIIAMMSALLFDVVEASLASTDGDQQVRLVESLAAQARDVLCTRSTLDNLMPSMQRVGLARSLIRLFSKRKRSEFVNTDDAHAKPSALTPGRATALLLDSLRGDCSACEAFEQRCGVPLNLGEILRVMMTKNSIPLLRLTNHVALLREKTEFAVEILVKLALSIQRNDGDKMEESAASITDFNTTCRLADSFIRQMETGDTRFTQIATSMVYVAASVSWMATRPSIDFDNWSADPCAVTDGHAIEFFFGLSEKYANKAAAILDEPSANASNWDHMASVLHSAIDLYRFQLDYVLLRGRMSHRFNLDRLQIVANNLDGSTMLAPSMVVLTKHCLVTVLSRLYGHFLLEGEDLLAVQVAQWNVDATRNDGSDPHSWFEAILLSLLTTGSVVSARLRDSDDAMTSQSAAFEDHACRLRLQTRDAGGFVRLDTIRDHFQLLLETLFRRPPDIGGLESKLLQHWSETTILLGLSDCAERRADLALSLLQLKRCFEACRNIAVSLRKYQSAGAKNTCECPFWTRAACASLPVRCAERQRECIQRTALLYSRLGDHKKAMSYALLALSSPSLKSAGLTSRSSFVNLVQLARIHPSQNCQEMSSRRLVLRLASQATPLDLVSAVFNGETSGLVLSSVEYPDGRKQLTLNRELEEIKDSYESTLTSVAASTCDLSGCLSVSPNLYFIACQLSIW